MRRIALFALSALFAVPAVAQNETSAAPTTTLKMDARLVTVPVTVRDKKGQLINNLKQQDFAITENGKPQSIRYFDRDNDLPLTVGLLVDVSGSVRSMLDEERDASSAFLEDMLAPDRDQAFLIQFGHSADLLADVTQSIPKLQAGLKKLDADDDRPSFSNNGNGGDNSDSQQSGDRRHTGTARGGTVLYDAIFLASEDVIAKQKNRKALILLTDGVDRGSKESISAAIEAAQRADTTVYAIYYKGEQHNGNGGGFPGGGGRHGGMGGGIPGIGYPRGGGGGNGGGYPRGGSRESSVDGKKILERITGETGGRMFEVSKKEPVSAIYKQIAEELRNQYRLGFTPANVEEGYHLITVDVPKDKKVTIQARDGYYIGSK